MRAILASTSLEPEAALSASGSGHLAQACAILASINPVRQGMSAWASGHLEQVCATLVSINPVRPGIPAVSLEHPDQAFDKRPPKRDSGGLARPSDVNVRARRKVPASQVVAQILRREDTR
jgi:hypothetical protein